MRDTRGTDGDHDLWVFAYGSLMWRPGFASVARSCATLTGYRRSFCIYSTHHRGSPQRPGLVLGLDCGGRCRGVAYRIAAPDVRATLNYLRAREQINGVYRETRAPIDVDGVGHVRALLYVAERAHPSYAGTLSAAAQAALIRAAHGRSGANLDYLASTLAHLTDLGLRERDLERVAVLAGVVLARGGEAARAGRASGLVRALRQTPILAPRMRPTDRRRFVHRMGMP